VRPALRKGFEVAALLLVVATSASACGAGSTTAPAQSEARQRIVSYVEAVNKIGAPFKSSPATAGPLRTAISELASVVPPTQFRASYERFLSGLRGEVSGFVQLERGERTHDAALIARGEATKAQQAAIASGAMIEAGAVLTNCQHDNFSC
jgi:hypothetical protein